jgi:hypothetical protein
MSRRVRKLLAGLWERIVPPTQAKPEEPARAIHGALKRLRQLSAGGVAVPNEVTRAVLAAEAACVANRGVVDPATGLEFYDACAKLALLAARFGEGQDAPIADSFSRATVNSEFMLKFASESGTAVPADVRTDLVAVHMMSAGEVPTGQARVRFYSAYAALAQLLGDVTADTIKACRSPHTKRALRKDVRRAIGWASLTVVVSVLLFTAAAIDKQLLDEIATANELAIKLRWLVLPQALHGAAPVPVPAPTAYVDNPCGALTTQPLPDDFKVKSQADLDQLQSFAIAVRGARTRANKLNFFILDTECDPYGYCWWGNATHNAEVEKKMLEPGGAVAMHNSFELNPAISNYTAEVNCKIQTWQEVRAFATNVEKTYEATSGGVVAHGLPILYALLGAYAYRLRQFSETVRNRTFHPSFADSARLITALIAGAVAGLFNPARDLTVSPLATAFLVGYGVEIFFRFIDASLNAYGGVGQPGANGLPTPRQTNGHQIVHDHDLSLAGAPGQQPGVAGPA